MQCYENSCTLIQIDPGSNLQEQSLSLPSTVIVINGPKFFDITVPDRNKYLKSIVSKACIITEIVVMNHNVHQHI